MRNRIDQFIAHLYFDTHDLPSVVAMLMDLGQATRPRYISAKEHGRDRCPFGGFQDFAEMPVGCFLFADMCRFNITYDYFGFTWIVIDASDGGSFQADAALNIIEHACHNNLMYGFAALEKEYKHRNLLSVCRSFGEVNAWLGRNINNGLPGLYWLNAISSRLMSETGISLLDLTQKLDFMSHQIIGATHFLCLYEEPQAWKKHARTIDKVCAETGGVLSMRQVMKDCGKYRNIQALSEFLSQFK